LNLKGISKKSPYQKKGSSLILSYFGYKSSLIDRDSWGSKITVQLFYLTLDYRGIRSNFVNTCIRYMVPAD
jgi:hypothetical protein